MSRRSKSSGLSGGVIVAILVFGFVGWVGEQVARVWPALLILGVLVTVTVVGTKVLRRAGRRAALMAKYQDAALVDRLLQKVLWQGETADQVQESLGAPAAIDDATLKTKSKQTWKYYKTGRGRFALRVTLEDNLVVGWETKGA